jgi:hypothetical protein
MRRIRNEFAPAPARGAKKAAAKKALAAKVVPPPEAPAPELTPAAPVA